jgi:diguanylate cyclase (GGDEF)-like protein
VGDRKLAEEIDETRVDPGYEAVIELATSIADDETGSAGRTERRVETLTFTSLVAMAAALSVLVFFILGSRERRRDDRNRIDADHRFRSLVEGSEDVITVITGDDDLSVLSPTLRSLQLLSSESTPTTLGELLSPDAFRVWSASDQRLRADGGHNVIEVMVEAGDGTNVHLEGHGSLLVSDPNQRVWVWRDNTARKELELELSHQAFHDSLTGVANRSLLFDRVEHALSIAARASRPTTVLFCDLDDFKSVNDLLGHSRGDELLKIITKRIQTCLRASDTIARLGGDEFAVLLEDTDSETAASLAERIISVVSYEVELVDHKIFPSISIGIATALPGADAEELLRNADLAMYSAKGSGKGHAEVYENEMHSISNDLFELQADLKIALADGQFSLHYQPILQLDNGRVEGVEALIRWQHPTRGNIPPDQFIHVAEANGSIIAIGRWVIQEACRAAIQVQAEHGRPVSMSINLSPLQLRDPTLIDTVKAALEDNGMIPEQLIFEVTEGCLLDDATAVERLRQLHALGVLIAIDDFGTGYTSINYLRGLPIDILKIDRSFVSGDVLANDERQAFLHAMVGLAKALNLRSVAEGIENVSQLDELTRLGCDTGQGFLWSPAVPLTATPSTIARIQAQALATTS